MSCKMYFHDYVEVIRFLVAHFVFAGKSGMFFNIFFLFVYWCKVLYKLVDQLYYIFLLTSKKHMIPSMLFDILNHMRRKVQIMIVYCYEIQ